MANTGLVPLKKNSIAGLSIKYPADDDDKLESKDLNSFNLGGIAEPRRPVWSTGNQTRRRKPNPKNRKPSGIVRDEDDDDDYHGYSKKKKQTGASSALPWFFNLMGPPGKCWTQFIVIAHQINTVGNQGLRGKTEGMESPGR